MKRLQKLYKHQIINYYVHPIRLFMKSAQLFQNMIRWNRFFNSLVEIVKKIGLVYSKNNTLHNNNVNMTSSIINFH